MPSSVTSDSNYCKDIENVLLCGTIFTAYTTPLPHLTRRRDNSGYSSDEQLPFVLKFLEASDLSLILAPLLHNPPKVSDQPSSPHARGEISTDLRIHPPSRLTRSRCQGQPLISRAHLFREIVSR